MKTYQDVVKAVLASSPKGTSLKDVLPEASKEWKRIKAGMKPTKGMASLSMKGKKDFTTKKSSKVFHRKGHYEKKGPEGKTRRPYRKTSRKGKGKKAKSSMLSEDLLLIEEKPMAGGAMDAADDEMKKDQMADEMSDNLEKAEETGEGTPNTMDNTVEEPGMSTGMGEGQDGGRRRRKSRMHRRLSRRTAKRRGGKRARKTHRRRRHY